MLCVALIGAFGGFVRYLIAVNEHLWLDELHSSWAVAGSFADVFGRAASGNQSPLFFWLAWPVVSVWGESELTIRMIGLVAGVATILLVGHQVSRWTGSIAGSLIAALLVALDVQFIYYGSEARPYSLLQLLGVAQVGFFWACVSKPLENQPKIFNWSSVGLTVTSVLLVYTHYTSVWVFLVEAVFATYRLVVNSDFRRYFLGTGLAIATVFIVLCVPALIQMTHIFERRANWVGVSSVEDLFFQQRIPIFFWLVIPSIVVLVSALSRRQTESLESELVEAGKTIPSDWMITGRLSQLGFVFAWALIPTLVVAALDFFEVAPLALVRYTLVGSVGMPIFAGLVVGALRNSRAKTALAIFLVTTGLYLSPITSSDFVSSGFNLEELGHFRQENWESPVVAINSNAAKSSHPVFLAANLIEDVEAFEDSDSRFQKYLLFPISGVHPVENSEGTRELIACPTLTTEHFRNEDISRIKQAEGCWVIVRGTMELANEFEDEIIRKSKAMYPNAGPMTVERFNVPGSVVYLLSLDW